MHGSGTFVKLPPAVMKLFVERAVAYGITLTRTSTSWNDFPGFEKELQELRAVGMETIVNLIYSVSPRHTDQYYAERARQAAAIRPYRICFKDVGGLLTFGAGASSHTGYPRECRRRAGRISWPLQQRLGTAVLLGGSETWHPNPAHRRAATR